MCSESRRAEGKQSERNQPKREHSERVWQMLISTAYVLGAIHTARDYAHALTECERRRILFRSTFDRRDPPDM